MKLRILILRSNPVHADPRVDKIAKTLGKAGYPVRVFGWDYTGNYPLEEQRPGYTVVRSSLPVKFSQGLANLGHELRWQFRLLTHLIQARNAYDVIHACDFDTVLPSLIVRGFYHKILIYDIFDFYADMLRHTPGLFVRIIRGMEIRAINQADAVILADDSRIQQIEGAQPKNIGVIYNTTEDVIINLSMEKTLENAVCSLRIAYVGNIQKERGLLVVLDVLKDHPDWSLDLAGFGGDEASIKSEAQKLPNVYWHGRVSYERGLHLSHNADVLFATYDPAIPNNRYASPNKIFEAMMLGKPIIVAQGTNMDRIILNKECGLIVEYGSKQDLEAALSKLEGDPHLRQHLGENARRAFEKEYNWETMGQRLLMLYGEITHK